MPTPIKSQLLGHFGSETFLDQFLAELT